MDYIKQMDREIGWDDTITQDAEEFHLVPAGDYQFIVEKFERGRFAGSSKMPPCNMAKLTIKLFDNVGNITVINHNLMLHTKTEWKLSEFFTAIGQKKRGQPLRPDWNRVVGSSGICKVIVKNYNGNDYNNIDKFYSAEEQQTVPTYSSNNQYTPGKF